MYICNIVTEKCHIIRKFQLKQWKMMSFGSDECEKISKLARWHADFHDIGLLSVACQWVHSVRNIYKMQMHCVADIAKWPIRY